MSVHDNYVLITMIGGSKYQETFAIPKKNLYSIGVSRDSDIIFYSKVDGNVVHGSYDALKTDTDDQGRIIVIGEVVNE